MPEAGGEPACPAAQATLAVRAEPLDAVEHLGGAMNTASDESLDHPRESAEVLIGGVPAAPVGALVEGLGDLFGE